jgi:hypothetical protein
MAVHWLLSIDKVTRRHANNQLETIRFITHSSLVAVTCLDMLRLVVFTTYNWRFILKTFIPSNTLGRRLMLASAGILLYANGALAAEFMGDAQTQARDLLSGSVGGRARIADVSSAIPTDDRHVSNLDPQEQARDVILGKSNFANTASQAISLDSKTAAAPAESARGIHRADADGQESAQRMILGKRA